MGEWRSCRSFTEGPTMLPAVSAHQAPPDLSAHQQFQGTRLGHCARTKRLVSYARALAEQPGKAIPELLASKYDIEATYDLFNAPRPPRMRSRPGTADWSAARCVPPVDISCSRTRRPSPSAPA